MVRGSLNPNLPDYFGWARPTFEKKVEWETNPSQVEDDLYAITALGKYRLAVHKEDQSVGKYLYRDGYWEIWIVQSLAKLIQPGWTVVDIGANYGYYTMFFADMVGHDGVVMAVEPQKDLINLISWASLRNNFDDRIVLVNSALSNYQGETTLVVPNDFIGDASIAYETNKDAKRYPVKVTRLDKILKHADFVKIDAEGSEEDILGGMIEIIEENPGIMIAMEWVGSRIKDPDWFFKFVEEFNITLFELSTAGTPAYISERQIRETPENIMLLLKGDYE